MKKFLVIANKTKQNIIPYCEEIIEYIKNKGEEVLPEESTDKPDVMVVIGGDGTLLKAAKLAAGKDIFVMAVNMGSLGFLTDIKKEEIFDIIDKYLNGNIKTEERNFLEITINGECYLALNEIVVAKGGVLSRMVKIKLYADGDYVNTYRADGIIVSTPTGSTAYNLSAGGPIMKPDIKAIIVTPIAPHTLSARPIVLGGSEKVTMEMIEEHKDMFATIDGQQSIMIDKNDNVEVFLSKKTVKLVKPENRDYYSILREKLKWGEENAKCNKH